MERLGAWRRVWGDPAVIFQDLSFKKDGQGLFRRDWSDRTMEMAFSWQRAGLEGILGRNFQFQFPCEGGEALAQGAP